MGFITEWGAVGSADGEFQTPFGVGVGPDGSVVVADQGNQRVQVFDRDGVHWSTWDGTSAGADGLTKPNGLEIDARGVVYVTDEFGLVRAFDIEGGYRTRIGDLPNVMQVTSGPATGLYPATSANFGPRTTAAGVSGSLSLVNDGTANPTLGCSALIGFPAGSVALVHSGGCAVTTKTVNAQAAGASAVVVIHASPGDPITMEGTQPGITISTVMVTQATGAVLSASLPATVTVRQNPSAAALIKPSDLAVSPDGTIYITDASTRFGPARWGGTFEASVLDILEQSATGRVLVYGDADGRTALVAKGLSFANGIALSADEQTLFVAETGRYRIWAIPASARGLDLSGGPTGGARILLDNLPGYPDNLMRGDAGRLWVGLVKPRNPVIDNMAAKPWLREMTLRLPRSLWPVPKAYGHVAAFTEDGRIVADWQDPSGQYPDTTAVTETADRVYIQSLHAHSLGWMPRPSTLP